MNKEFHYLRRSGCAGELMMPDGSSYSRDCNVTGLNNNIAVIGPSGSGKSSVMGILNAINANSSFIISDPKGGLYRTLNNILTDMGYNIQKLDLTHPEKSAHYNPLNYVRTTQDIRKIANTIVYSSYGEDGKGNSRDPYWENSAESLLCSFIAYLKESDCPETDITLTKVMDMLSRFIAAEDMDDRPKLPIYRDFIAHEANMRIQGKDSWACKLFKPFSTLSEKTLSCVISTLTSLLVSFDSEEIARMFHSNDFDFKMLGKEKTAIFVIVSDTDRANDLIANLFYTQAMNELCDYADNHCEDGKLTVPVTFLLDDFATNCRINGFENIISNIRARNISTIIMLQSMNQLEQGYGKNGQTIINNCDTVIFMGANSPSDASYFSLRANKPIHEMLEMPLHTSWIFRRSEKPRFAYNINPNEYLADINQCIEEADSPEHSRD